MSNYIDFTLMKLRHLEKGQGVKLLTFKKDRWVTVIREEENFSLYEEGFHKAQYLNLDEKELRKELKAMARKEFPRSNRLHLVIVEGLN